MRFSKWHALGNSYLVVDRAETGSELGTEQVRRLCDTGHGVGAHGVLEVVAADRERAEIDLEP